MFDYILLPAPLQPLTKRRHRINCVKIVLPLGGGGVGWGGGGVEF